MTLPILPISREDAERWASALHPSAWTTDITLAAAPLNEGLRYWQSLPAPLGCPEIQQFDTLEIASCLKDAYISERQPDDGVAPIFQSFFIGPRFEQRLSIASTRKQIFPLADVSSAHLLQLREASLLIDVWRGPLVSTGTFSHFKNLNYLKFEALYLPLCDSTGTISRVITLLDFGPDKQL